MAFLDSVSTQSVAIYALSLYFCYVIICQTGLFQDDIPWYLKTPIHSNSIYDGRVPNFANIHIGKSLGIFI